MEPGGVLISLSAVAVHDSDRLKRFAPYIRLLTSLLFKKYEDLDVQIVDAVLSSHLVAQYDDGAFGNAKLETLDLRSIEEWKNALQRFAEFVVLSAEALASTTVTQQLLTFRKNVDAHLNGKDGEREGASTTGPIGG